MGHLIRDGSWRIREDALRIIAQITTGNFECQGNYSEVFVAERDMELTGLYHYSQTATGGMHRPPSRKEKWWFLQERFARQINSPGLGDDNPLDAVAVIFCLLIPLPVPFIIVHPLIGNVFGLSIPDIFTSRMHPYSRHQSCRCSGLPQNSDNAEDGCTRLARRVRKSIRKS